MDYYSVLIDGKPYEGSYNAATAKYLYETIDKTISKEYDGSTKILVKIGNRYDQRTWHKCLEDKINVKTISDLCEIDTDYITNIDGLF